MLTLPAFVVALGLLIAIHEWGHYRMALACGVRVLRFSIGFGRPLLRWQGRNGVEFTIGMLPLGGYVRMLDEREAEVPPELRPFAFNQRPLAQRAAIVAAGPLANLVLAVLLYAAVSWLGVPQAQPILSRPPAGSLAEQAGLRGGEIVHRVARADGDAEPVPSFEALGWVLTQAALAGEDVRLWAAPDPQAADAEFDLRLSALAASEVDPALMRRIGIVAPRSAPLIGQLVAGAAAERAGLRPGDRVLEVDAQRIVDAEQLRALIRAAPGVEQAWTLQRGEQRLTLSVRPQPEGQGDGPAGSRVGRIGALVGSVPESVTVSQDFSGGLAQGLRRTREVAAMTLGMMGRMVLGQASLDNLSGPLSIADYAGKAAGLGLVAYLQFLALISVSLGVLNLLPLPVLDGGHLLYYLWEGVTGHPVPELWLERLQRGGIAILVVLMSVAVFNDLARLLG